MMHKELVDVTDRYESKAGYYYVVGWSAFYEGKAGYSSYAILRDEAIKSIRFNSKPPRFPILIFQIYKATAPTVQVNSYTVLEDGTYEVKVEWPDNAVNMYINGSASNPPHIYRLE